ncbi:MAG TPA: response regulator [Anaerolineae bacterium]|nr:response regulator [Anaerolineae bacterium]
MQDAADDLIRVMIVDDIAETRENIRKLLQFEPDIEVVGAARSGQEALEMARETEPDIVLMDINMPDMDGITATEAIKRDVRFAQIVILSVQAEADYLRKAMRAGASDFIAKPPSGDELIGTIRSLAVEAKRSKGEQKILEGTGPLPPIVGPGRIGPEGKLIAVYSAKGGVGCTIIATNLAVGLDTADTPTVLVDTALQFGDVAVCLNLQSKNSFVDLSSRIDELEVDIVDEVLLQHDSGLRVLAAPPRPEMADEINANQVRTILQYLKNHFAYVVVDTGSTMDDITLTVLDLADLLVSVATPEIPAIKDARLLFDLLSVLEFPKEDTMFVLNKMDRRSGITASAIAENLKCTVDGEIPFDERTVTTSVNRGIPFLIADKGQPAAKGMLEVLGAVKQRLVERAEAGTEERETERPRLFSRA